ncbi:protein NLRC3-like [Synchiropus splendidus]|uniref:protein NLRC3-like n=1 Tax=Synchiropus splendidus TaxID=270530 RepID=UPI00237EDACD|nr:protein NLRC3-like [Synchiropus splendidus]
MAAGVSRVAPSVSAAAEGGSTVNSLSISDNQVHGDMSVNISMGPQHGPKKGLKQKYVTKLRSFLGKKKKRNFPYAPTVVPNCTDLLITEEKGEDWQGTDREMVAVECQQFGGNQVLLQDIFKPSSGEQEPPQKVLTKGIAGVGKSVAVQKFTHDWAAGKANQNLQLLFPFSFRELNHLVDRELSLKDLIDHFFEEVKDLSPEDYDTDDILFVFDGLDVKQFDLNLKDVEVCRSMEQKTTIGVILSNLVTGQLLHRSKVWITSRPTATGDIPEGLFDRVTHIHGFSENQISEFFRKTIQDQSQAKKILEHLRSKYLPNIMVMCRIPLFSWLAAKSLKSLVKRSEDPQLAKTITELYIHFLIHRVQNSGKRDFVMKLGKFAYNQWMKGNTGFYKEDLARFDITLDDKDQASILDGFCSQILQKVCGLYIQETYCFIHPMLQEFLAALYVLETFLSSGTNLLPEQYGDMEQKILLVQPDGMEMALKCPNGDRDMFRCFLFGLVVEENQKHLEMILGPRENPEKVKTITDQTGKRRRTSVKKRIGSWFACLGSGSRQHRSGPIPVPEHSVGQASLLNSAKALLQSMKRRLTAGAKRRWFRR